MGGLRLADQFERAVERVRLAVAVAGGDALVDARFVHLDAEKRGAVHRGGERLGAAHAAEAGGEHEPAGEGAREVAAGHGAEGLEGTLEDALRADVDPRAGGHLAEHREAGAFERAEVFPGGPAAHEIGVGDQHARGAGVGAEHRHGLAALDDQCLVMIERPQRGDDGVERLPAARRPARAAVHDQVVGALGDVGIEVVHQHAQGRFLRPPLARERRAARRPHRAGAGGGRWRTPRRRGHDPLAVTGKWPSAMAPASRAMSPASTRSPASGATSARTAAWARAAPRPGRSGAR